MSSQLHWLVQEPQDLNPDCLGDIRSFCEKTKTSCCKLTVQTLYRKSGDKKLDDNFLYNCFSPFLKLETTFAFFHSEENLPKRKQFGKIISRRLHTEIPQNCNMRLLIMSWSWPLLGSKFLIILYIYIYIYIYLLLKKKSTSNDFSMFGKLTFLLKICEVSIIIINWRYAKVLFPI